MAVILNCPACSISKDSNPNAENVVKPPKMPMTANSRRGRVVVFPKPSPTKIPRRVQPIKLTAKVPKGKPKRVNWENQVLAIYRNAAPIKPPAPTNKISFIQSILKWNIFIRKWCSNRSISHFRLRGWKIIIVYTRRGCHNFLTISFYC